MLPSNFQNVYGKKGKESSWEWLEMIENGAHISRIIDTFLPFATLHSLCVDWIVRSVRKYVLFDLTLHPPLSSFFFFCDRKPIQCHFTKWMMFVQLKVLDNLFSTINLSGISFTIYNISYIVLQNNMADIIHGQLLFDRIKCLRNKMRNFVQVNITALGSTIPQNIIV